jgi:hypothetical protein
MLEGLDFRPGLPRYLFYRSIFLEPLALFKIELSIFTQLLDTKTEGYEQTLFKW